jgi:uncharacterized protein YaaR (DUF327 family)
MADSINRVRRDGKPFSTRLKAADQARKGAAVEPAESAVPTNFNDVLAGVSGRPSERKLEAILNEIKDLAKTLAHRRLLEDLDQYRRKVGEFLKVYMDDVLGVREAAGRRGVSRRKQMIVVKKIDVELEELSRMVMGGAPEFKIMSELGTIEGLLMDLYR